MSPTLWEEGSLSDRVYYLKTLRQTDPAAARALLETDGFAKESARDREAFVRILESGLSSADEPFLERCLDDRSKQVRHTAVLLISAIPVSAFSRRMAARVGACVSLKKGLLRKELIVEPPDQIDASATRDGIPAAPPAGRTIGQKAFWLETMVSLTPLSFWTDHLAPTPADVVRLARKNEWAQTLYEGWWQAADHQRGTEWLIALSSATEVALPASEVAALLQRLEPSGREALIRNEMVSHNLTVDTVSVLSGLIADCPAPWSRTFGEEVLYWLETVLNRFRNRNELNWTVGESFRLIAYLLPLDLLDEALTLVEAGTEQVAQLLERTENFHAVLMKRAVLKKELVDHG